MGGGGYRGLMLKVSIRLTSNICITLVSSFATSRDFFFLLKIIYSHLGVLGCNWWVVLFFFGGGGLRLKVRIRLATNVGITLASNLFKHK